MLRELDYRMNQATSTAIIYTINSLKLTDLIAIKAGGPKKKPFQS
jgi:hypothetical protein